MTDPTTSEAKKVTRDGQVAVLISPGYGAGWSTWINGGQESRAVFCPELVGAVERKASPGELITIAERLFPDGYCGGAAKLAVEWVRAGTAFRVHEYDGSESLVILSLEAHHVA